MKWLYYIQKLISTTVHNSFCIFREKEKENRTTLYQTAVQPLTLLVITTPKITISKALGNSGALNYSWWTLSQNRKEKINLFFPHFYSTVVIRVPRNVPYLYARLFRENELKFKCLCSLFGTLTQWVTICLANLEMLGKYRII